MKWLAGIFIILLSVSIYQSHVGDDRDTDAFGRSFDEMFVMLSWFATGVIGLIIVIRLVAAA